MTDHAEIVRNFYRKQGAKDERETIIKLLADAKSQYDNFIEARPNRTDIGTWHTIARTYQDAIALIEKVQND